MTGDAGSTTVLIRPEGEGPPRRPRGVGGIGVGLLVVVALAGLVLIGLDRGRPPPQTPSPAPDLNRAPSPAPPPGRGEPRWDDVSRSGAGPLFDEPIGLVAVVGGPDHELHLIDFDTGDVTALGAWGRPWLFHDGAVLIQSGDGRWALVDPVDPTPMPVVLPVVEPNTDEHGRSGYDAAVGAESGGVWFRRAADQPGRAGASERVWLRLDPVTGEVSASVTLPAGASAVAGSDGTPLSGPEIVGRDEGGVFALDAEGDYRRIDTGLLAAVGGTEVLVSDCGGPPCRQRWIERRARPPAATSVGTIGQTTSTAEPARPESFVVQGRLADTVLMGEVALGGVVKLFDPTTGRAVATGSPSGLARSWLSPSGRFLAVPGFDALVVTDLAAGRRVTVDRLRMHASLQVVWGRRTA